MHAIFQDRRYLIPFRASLLPQIFTDTLVIGGGVAGLRAAIEAAGQGEVIVVAKGDFRHTNTAWAQGGVACATGAGDCAASHAEDTLEAGAGLCDEPVVRRVVENAPRLVDELISWGLRVDRDDAGGPALGREGGHSHARILHSDGDATGAEFQRVLLARASAQPNVRIFERCFALDLVTPSDAEGAPVIGAITHHPRYGLQMVWARTTILATGGAGMLFRETTNPAMATADGLAMAYRAGATVADMAFVQFHPTTLYVAGAARSLITEAIRGAGAHLLDDSGGRFMVDEHALAELAPRDVVSQAIVRRIAQQGGGKVFLDCRHVASFAARFPAITATLRQFNLDPAKDLIPVYPAAHYMVGGVRTDAEGRTNIQGLLAAGEAACAGLHGANRLASNSLLEGLVMGEAAGRLAGEAVRTGNGRRGPVAVVSDIRPSGRGELDLLDVRSSLRSAMWRNVGVERTGEKLHGAVDMIEHWATYTLDKIFDDPFAWETQNMLLAGALVAESARWREESRGCHSRDDFPSPREDFRVHDGWSRRRGAPERMAVTT
ncbi:MAG TPA: L-aspartate oxidase [Phycisphaerales bacterium]|nr:L-aspartate oxidase [Phycisphaerales bacterium]